MTQMLQQLTRMRFYTNSRITPELLQRDHWVLDPNRIPETWLSPARPGTACERSEKSLFDTCSKNIIFSILSLFLVIAFKSTLDAGRSCMRRSCFSRNTSWSSSTRSVRDSLKFKARSTTSSGLVPTSRYFTHRFPVLLHDKLGFQNRWNQEVELILDLKHVFESPHLKQFGRFWNNHEIKWTPHCGLLWIHCTIIGLQ